MRFDPCPTRRIEPLGICEASGFRLKVYGINRPTASLREAAVKYAEGHLSQGPTSHRHEGVGFLGIHAGQGANQVFLDLWINQNELKHDVWISTLEKPKDLVDPPEDYNSVCVWDLFVQAYEREAWLRHILRNSNGPDIDAYLANVFDGEV